MPTPNVHEIARKYSELKAKLPSAVTKAQQNDATLETSLPIIKTIRERVLKQFKSSQYIDPSVWFIACYGEEILRRAASVSHQDWLNLSTEVAALANELSKPN